MTECTNAVAEVQTVNINAKEGEINFSLEYKRKLHEEGTGAALDLGLEE